MTAKINERLEANSITRRSSGGCGTMTVESAAASLIAAAVLLAGCGDDSDSPRPAEAPDESAALLDEVVEIEAGRGLYVRCTGTDSPTVVMEGGDLDTSDSYAFAEEGLAAETRTCVYDRANLGQSDPAPGPRGLDELVGDLESLLEAAPIPGPYVLVGTSGGGYISAGYAVEHPDEIAGMVLVETAAPFQDPPAPIVKETDPSHPSNLERRDFLQVEIDAWDAREEIGDVPVTVISNRYAKDEIAASPFPSEQRLMRENVEDQKGWLVLSPRAEQVVVTTGHEIEVEDPELVIDAILDVVRNAR